MKSISLYLILSVCLGQARAQPGLTVEVRRGEAMPARASETGPGRIEVVVRGAAGQPVANATVTFTLPREGATGVFASGLSSESVLTASDGTVSVGGIVWGDTPGVALIHVKASYGGDAGEAVVTVEVRPGEGEARARSGRQGAKKWVLAAAAAGALLAGVAFAGGKSSSGAGLVAAQPATSTAPTLGAPSISVGKP